MVRGGEPRLSRVALAACALALVAGACSLDLDAIPRRDAGGPALDASTDGSADARPRTDAIGPDAPDETDAGQPFVDSGVTCACNIMTSVECGASDSCYVASAFDGVTCRPTGALPAWEACTMGNACVPGILCLPYLGSSLADSVCRPACDGDVSCEREGEGSACVRARPEWDACIQVCSRSCDPLMTSNATCGRLGKTLQCGALRFDPTSGSIDGYTECVLLGSGALAGPCDPATPCGLGLVCVADACRQWCDASSGSTTRCTEMGALCTEHVRLASGRLLGVCLPP